MAKKKTESEEIKVTNEDELFKKLATSVGCELLSELGACFGFIDTGVLALNYIVSGKFIGGGFPQGSMAEIYGPEGCGKSLIGTNVLAGVQRCNGIAHYHDAERALNPEFSMKASKVNTGRVIVTDSNTLQKSFNELHKVYRTVRKDLKIPMERPIASIYDSIAVSPSEREFVETEFDLNEISDAALKAAGGGNEKPGERARICSGELRKLMPVVKESNVFVLFVNQLRKKIGVMFGPDETTTGGGESLKYYCSTRLRMHASALLKNDNEKVIGNRVSFTSVKSRFTAPHQKASNIVLLYEKGIDPFGGLLELMIQNERVTGGGAGNYQIADPWRDGKSGKFKTTKESGLIPVEVLLEYPQLVDAESKDQVQFYVDLYSSTISSALNEVNKEEALVEE